MSQLVQLDEVEGVLARYLAPRLLREAMAELLAKRRAAASLRQVTAEDHAEAVEDLRGAGYG